jgi:hypothetical protein
LAQLAAFGAIEISASRLQRLEPLPLLVVHLPIAGCSVPRGCRRCSRRRCPCIPATLPGSLLPLDLLGRPGGRGGARPGAARRCGDMGRPALRCRCRRARRMTRGRTLAHGGALQPVWRYDVRSCRGAGHSRSRSGGGARHMRPGHRAGRRPCDVRRWPCCCCSVSA